MVRHKIHLPFLPPPHASSDLWLHSVISRVSPLSSETPRVNLSFSSARWRGTYWERNKIGKATCAGTVFASVCLNCWIKAWCNLFRRCFGLRRLAMICHLRKEKEETLKALTTLLQYLWRLNSFKVRWTKEQNMEVFWKRSCTGHFCLSCCSSYSFAPYCLRCS